MKHLFVPYEIARQLKEKGFDEPCFGRWEKKTEKHKLEFSYKLIDIYTDNNVKTITQSPLYQQVIDWFREKHKLYVNVEYNEFHDYFYGALADLSKEKYIVDSLRGKTYYQALTKAIEKALKLI